jgi:hypothetical protein
MDGFFVAKLKKFKNGSRDEEEDEEVQVIKEEGTTDGELDFNNADSGEKDTTTVQVAKMLKNEKKVRRSSGIKVENIETEVKQDFEKNEKDDATVQVKNLGNEKKNRRSSKVADDNVEIKTVGSSLVDVRKSKTVGDSSEEQQTIAEEETQDEINEDVVFPRKRTIKQLRQIMTMRKKKTTL